MNAEEQQVQEVEVVLTRGRFDSVQAEQALCNEALESGSFDTMSDAEWVEMCRRAAAGERMDATAE